MPVDRYDEICAAHRWSVPRAVQHRARVLHALGERPRALRALLGGRVGRDRRVHVLGPAAAREPPVQRARGAGRARRRQGRADPSAAAGNGGRAHRRVSAGRHRRAAVVPVRPRRARVPARRFRGEGRVRRPAVAAQPRADPRPLSRASRTSSASPARARRGSRRTRRCSRRRRRASTPVATRPADPALLIYTSGTTGPPKGALMPQQCLLGNLPGFVHSHDGYPRERRPLLVAGRLGVDRRPDGRAAAGALLRPADRRLPRALRSGARVRADREVRRSATRSCSRPRSR